MLTIFTVAYICAVALCMHHLPLTVAYVPQQGSEQEMCLCMAADLARFCGMLVPCTGIPAAVPLLVNLIKE